MSSDTSNTVIFDNDTYSYYMINTDILMDRLHILGYYHERESLKEKNARLERAKRAKEFETHYRLK